MKLFTLSIFLFLPQSILAGSTFCESTQSGAWSDSATWASCDGTFPNESSYEAVIKNGHTVALDIDSVILQKFTMETNSTLDVNSQINPVIVTITSNDFEAAEGQININTTSFEINVNNGNDIRLGLVDGDSHLTLNSSGTTSLLDAIGSVTPIQSITTDSAGSTRTHGGQYTIKINGNTDTVINDVYLVGASSRATWEQLGIGNIIYNNAVTQTSGSPQRLTVDLTGGGDVEFNDTVILGDLTVNGAGQALIGANVTTRHAGANQGLMTFNVPVIITNDVTFKAEDGMSNIYFNSTLDDDGDNMTSSNVIIDSLNSIQLSAVGQSNGLSSLTLQNATSVLLTDDITTINNQNYLIDLMQFADVVFSSLNSEVVLSGINLNGNNFSTTINQANMLELNILDTQNINTLTIGPLGQTALNGDFTLSGNLALLNDMTIGADSVLTVNDLQTKAIDAGLSDLTINVTSANSVIDGTLTGVDASLTKTGTGTLVTAFGSSLNNNNAIDAILVQAGRLNTGSTHNDRIVVNNDATLGGSGTINNTVILNDQSQIDPGSNDTQSARSIIVSTISMGVNTTSHFDLYGQNDNDQLIVNSVININGNLTVGGPYSPTIGNSFLIIEVLSPKHLNPFVGLPEGSSPALGLTVSYIQDLDNSYVVLNAVCEAQATVNSTSDTGAGSLRQAVTDVCDGGTIKFAQENMFITLDSLISIDKTITIEGNSTIVSGGFSNQIFNVETNGNLTLNTLQIVAGNSGFGAIRNLGQLTVNQSYFGDNQSSGALGLGGGAIVNFDQVEINQSTFYRNNALRGGALVNALDATMTVNNSTFYENGNNLSSEGGVMHNRGIATFTNSTMVNSGDGEVGFGNTISMFGDQAVTNLINSVISSTSLQDECNNSSGTINNINSFVHDGTCDATLSGDAMLGDWVDGNSKGFIGTHSYIIPPLPGSPLVNSGSAVECPATDQLGVARPQGTGCDIGAVEITDSVAPSVIAANLNNQTINQCDQIASGETSNFNVTFSERMLNAEILNLYQLEHAGEDFHFDDSDIKGGQFDNLIFNPTAVISDGNSNNPTITLSFDSVIPDGLVRLVINNTVTDEFSNGLNEGEDFYWMYRIDGGNLLLNGHFDDCGQNELDIINNHWQYNIILPDEPAAKGLDDEFQLGFFDANDSNVSSSLFVETEFQSSTYQMTQCSNVDGSLNLPLEMQATALVLPLGGPRNEENNNDKGSSVINIELMCQLWDQTDCMGSPLNTLTHQFPPIEFIFSPTELGVSLGLPDNTSQSTYCELNMSPTENNQLGIMIDGIRLIQQDLIFEDGFESEVVDD